MVAIRRLLPLALTALVAAFAVAAPGALGNSTGAPANAEIQGCTCHRSADPSVVTLRIEGAPERIEAEKTYALKFIVDAPVATYDPDPVREKIPVRPPGQYPAPGNLRLGGFLANVSVGTLASADANAQNLMRPGGARTPGTLTHTSEGARLREWNGTWTIPPNASRLPASASLRFYGLQANSDGFSGHDNWTQTTLQLEIVKPTPPTPAPAKAAAGPAFLGVLAATLGTALRRRRPGFNPASAPLK